MFLYNNWYVAAFAHSVPAGTTLARRVCDKPIVIFRTEQGRAAALEDRCSHRGMPLAAGGRCQNNIIRCPYHGFEYDENGTCVKVPSQTTVPAGANIRSYPLVERDAVLWVWVGDPARADADLIPPHPYHADPAWEWTSMMFEFAADAMLVLDNLMDLTHVAFVHDAVINGDPNAHTSAQTRIKPTPRGLQVIRHLPNSEPPPQYTMGGNFKGKIDRWQEYDFVPGLCRFWTGGTDAGTGAYEGRRVDGVQLRTFHGITPKSSHSCYYHFSLARNYGLGNEQLAARMQEGARITIDVEDRRVIEAQQARILEEPERGFVDIQADAAGIQIRRMMRRLIEKERATMAAP